MHSKCALSAISNSFGFATTQLFLHPEESVGEQAGVPWKRFVAKSQPFLFEYLGLQLCSLGLRRRRSSLQAQEQRDTKRRLRRLNQPAWKSVFAAQIFSRFRKLD